jgi:cullin 3
MIELKDEFYHFLTDAFNNDRDFMNCIQSTFENFLNLSSKEPKFLCLYIDDKLLTNKGVPKLNATELESILDKAIEIFRFLHDKHLFQEYYAQYLAKRLLLSKSMSHYADDEKLMIDKLKAECGFEYVSKIEGMLRDMELSDIIMNAYKEHESVDYFSF